MRRRQAAAQVRPLLEIDGCRFYVGRNSRHNDLLTFGVGRPGDLWLHAHEVPGSHVLVRRPDGSVSEIDLERGASLAAWFSTARDGGRVAVDVADLATVKRIPGAPPGRVTFRAHRQLRVDPHRGRDLLAGASGQTG